MKHLYSLIIVLLISFATQTLAQGPNLLWVKDIENGRDVQQTSDGGYLLLGADWLMKTDSQGNTLWSKGTYGGDCRCLNKTADGGYIITGGRLNNIFLMKITQNGDTLWTRDLYIGAESYGHFIQETFDGGYIMTATVDIDWYRINYIVKTTDIGDTLWTQSFTGLDRNSSSVQQTHDGCYIVTGTMGDYENGFAFLSKIDNEGSLIWTNTFGPHRFASGRGVRQTLDGGYAIIGARYIDDPIPVDFIDIWFIKTDQNGDSLWTKTYSWLYSNSPNNFQQTSDGGYIITIAGEGPIGLMKTDEGGNEIWRIEGDYTKQVIQTNDNGYVGLSDWHYRRYGGETPLPVDSLLIDSNNMDVHLSWSPVTQAESGAPITPDAYLVYYSGVPFGDFYFHGFTQDTTYVHPGVVFFSDHMFYQVSAYVGGIQRLQSLVVEQPHLTQKELRKLLDAQ